MDQKVKEKLKPTEKSYFSTQSLETDWLSIYFQLLFAQCSGCLLLWAKKFLDLGLKTQVCHVVAQMLGGFINRPQIFWQIFTDLLGARKKYDCKKAQK